ncbi:unnamed protein product, partial [Ectocarpus sp. 4 AP-2014]
PKIPASKSLGRLQQPMWAQPEGAHTCIPHAFGAAPTLQDWWTDKTQARTKCRANKISCSPAISRRERYCHFSARSHHTRNPATSCRGDERRQPSPCAFAENHCS